MKMKLSKMEFFIKPLLIVITMFIAVKLSFTFIIGILGNTLSTILAIAIGAIVYILATFTLGGIKKEELLSMPKGDKVYKVLRKLKIMK